MLAGGVAGVVLIAAALALIFTDSTTKVVPVAGVPTPAAGEDVARANVAPAGAGRRGSAGTAPPGTFSSNFAGGGAAQIAGPRGQAGDCSTAVAPQTELTKVKAAFVQVGGSPFGVVTTSDGKWSFVTGAGFGGSATRPGGQVEVLSDSGFAPRLVRTLALPVQSAQGATLTHDGRYLLAAAGTGAVVVDVPAAEAGHANSVVGTLQVPVSGAAGARPAPAGLGGSAIEVVASLDDRFAFVADEYADEINVFDLRSARAHGFRSSGFVGTIPLGRSVVGMALSPDGRRLYATSEVGTDGSGDGTLSVIDVARAETKPARAVVGTAPAGCGAVRVAVSADGRTVWVTARESDRLLAFSAAKLESTPAKARIASVRVGEAPVGLALIDGGRRIVVADSDRFNYPGATPGLSVVDTSAALAGTHALLGVIPAGGFPRELSLEPGGGTLLVTNFASGQLEAVDTTDIP